MDRQPSAESVFWQAFLLHQQGKLTEAEQLYRTALRCRSQFSGGASQFGHFARSAKPVG